MRCRPISNADRYRYSRFESLDIFSARLISSGTTTRQPLSAKRRANCSLGGNPSAKPAICSGSWLQSGKAITLAKESRPRGSSNRPVPVTSPNTGQLTARTVMRSVCPTSDDSAVVLPSVNPSNATR